MPLPTEPFTWRHLPEIVDVDTVTTASEAVNTKRPFPRPDLLLVERLPASKGPSPHSGHSLVCHCVDQELLCKVALHV